MTGKRGAGTKAKSFGGTRRFGTMLVCCVAASAVIAGPAWAGLQESFHDEQTFVQENLCGVAGLTVSVKFVVDGRTTSGPHGPGGFAYSLDHVRETSVITNV